MLPPDGGIFSILPVLFVIVFLAILASILFRAVTGVRQWQSNNQQPVLTVSARVVSKRMKVSRYTTNTNGQAMFSNATVYYVTFEFQSGDRLELKVHGQEYGILAEGDVGNLTFQGTRFHSLERM